MKVLFTDYYKVADESEAEFHEGQVYDLPNASANHFIKRGVAKKISDDELAEIDSPDDGADPDEWPKHTGGGWYELPDGSRIRGKQAALDVYQGGE